MDQLPTSIDDQLLEYLDGTLRADERAAIETLIQQNESIAGRLEALRVMHVLMAEQKPEMPALDFTAKVMRGLDSKPAAVHLSIRQAVFVVLGILAIIGIAAALVSAGVFDGTLTTVDLNRVAPSNRFFKDSLPAFSLNGKVIVNGIIFLNLALAFVVLDRAILRPFFQRRLQGGH